MGVTCGLGLLLFYPQTPASDMYMILCGAGDANAFQATFFRPSFPTAMRRSLKKCKYAENTFRFRKICIYFTQSTKRICNRTYNGVLAYMFYVIVSVT